LTSVSIPLYVNVTDKIKAKIWEDEYIDLNLIAEPDTPAEFSFQLIPRGGGGQIKLTPSKPPKAITTVG
jgi:hypothetical protein